MTQSPAHLGERPQLAAAHVYTLGASAAEQHRLRQQAADLRAHSRALLDHVDLEPGQRAIDLGCGPAGVIDLLSERVGPAGSVVGLDVNPDHVALARSFAREHELANVDIVQGDARRTGLLSASFDLVHARLLLVNIPDPAAVVAEMVRLVRPGGWVVAAEADVVPLLCQPPHQAWDRLGELFVTVYHQDGADPFLGRRLPELFRQAGLTSIGVEARADVHPLGHPRRTILPDLVRSLRPKILARGLIEERELNELDRAAREHLDDPTTLTLPYLQFQAWGRKPTGGTLP